MSIKSTGGIFGRNPTFNDVEVDGTLTVGGNLVPDASTILVDGDIGSTVQGYDADTAKLDVAQTWTADQKFQDNVKIDIGTGSDLSIYHDGTNSWIKESNASGNFFIDASNFYLRSDDGQAYIVAVKDSYVRLYHDDNVKLQTTSTGISVTGDITVDSGNGIDFSATAGTGTSELFDDYEEGTWTPVIAGNTVAGSNTYTVQNGYYTKIGNRVLINLDIAMSNKDAAMDGHVKITGLPFTPSTASNNQASMAFGRYDNVDLSAGYTQLVAMVQVSGTFLPREVGDNVAAQLIDDAAMSNTSRFQLSGHYFV